MKSRSIQVTFFWCNIGVGQYNGYWLMFMLSWLCGRHAKYNCHSCLYCSSGYWSHYWSGLISSTDHRNPHHCYCGIICVSHESKEASQWSPIHLSRFVQFEVHSYLWGQQQYVSLIATDRDIKTKPNESYGLVSGHTTGYHDREFYEALIMTHVICI